ncbi:MAG TPA: hypothetical protein VEL76_18945 [Gemmataceae bacterium]|nr:hypothetical protein [Gemmataceae bacterium]
MSLSAIVIQGIVKPDGTLELEGKVPLPAGKVQVTLEPLSLVPQDHPFWKLLQDIWTARQEAGLQPRSAAEIEAERQRFRDEVEEEIAEAGQL